ncbi:MAG: hypothetical protein O7C71_04145 [Rickettsia endosymbiont of Ixodes ricinus]|nr:hypothetical protein [Rickettsia endosymbiont of Ixodes ricinus]
MLRQNLQFFLSSEVKFLTNLSLTNIAELGDKSHYSIKKKCRCREENKKADK